MALHITCSTEHFVELKRVSEQVVVILSTMYFGHCPCFLAYHCPDLRNQQTCKSFSIIVSYWWLITFSQLRVRSQYQERMMHDQKLEHLVPPPTSGKADGLKVKLSNELIQHDLVTKLLQSPKEQFGKDFRQLNTGIFLEGNMSSQRTLTLHIPFSIIHFFPHFICFRLNIPL